jgi:alkylhydroperoxidase family enzyme
MSRLTAIENPDSLLMRFAYWLTRKKVGKVITPLKTLYARLPFAFAWWINDIQRLEKKLPLPEDLKLMLNIYVAQLNTCLFCIDIARAHAIHQFDDTGKFFQVQDFENSPLYTASEKAALRFARELTVDKKISDTTYRAARKHFSEQQLIGIAWIITSEHVYNLMNLAFEIESDSLCNLPQNSSVGRSAQPA